MKKYLKNNAAITLISLVMSIIIILILSTVIIGTITRTGLLEKTKDAKLKSKRTEVIEWLNLKLIEEQATTVEKTEQQIIEATRENIEKSKNELERLGKINDIEDVETEENGENVSPYFYVIVDSDKYKVENSGVKFVEDQENVDLTANIQIPSKTVISGQDLEVLVKYSNNVKECRWVYNTESNKIGTKQDNYPNVMKAETITLNVSTIGTYYLHILIIDNAGNKKEIISEAITVSYPTLVSQVSVGDYVAYDATNNYSYTSPKGTGMSHGNGYGDQSFISSSDVKWRVLSKDTSTGEVVLISDEPIQTKLKENLHFTSAIGYLYAEEELNRICSIYGYGIGADKDKEFNYTIGDIVEGTQEGIIKGSGSRSITDKDINEITGYKINNDKYGTFYEHSIIYPTMKNLNGYSAETGVRKDVYTGYHYVGADYLNNSDIMYSLLFEKKYWLSERYVGSFSNEAQFRIFMVCDGRVDNSCVFAGDNIARNYDEEQAGVRPLVYLKTDLKTSGKNSNDAWSIREMP